MTMSENQLLRLAARLFNIQTTFYDACGTLIQTPPEAVLRVLHVLGAPVERMDDLADAVRQRRQFLWRRGIDPVVVAWEGSPLGFKLRLPSRFAAAQPVYRIVLETGESLEGTCQNDTRIRAQERSVEGVRYVTRQIIVPEKLPLGYHRLHLQAGDFGCDSHLLSALAQTYADSRAGTRQWGLFCPVYALASEKGWGAGNFSDLEDLVDFTSQMGGDFVATLPVLSAFLDEPFNPSPYAPVSRLFWNEFYLDVARIPELRRSPVARAMIQSAGFRGELESLRTAPLIDYRRLMALKRRVLEELLHCLMNQRSKRRTSFERFIATQPLAQDYAAFRAKVDRERKPWELWPAASREGTLGAGDYDETNKQYHLYVQWQASEQMRALGDKARAGGPALYLDFPLGVNRDGYDVWRERQVFALEASGGAPPDGFFTKGQNWGFPPLHPEGLRQQGYRYYIQCLRHHLQHAGMLRIDHVMGLHRLYWIPHGFSAAEGAYVHYPAEEFYAILSLESHRNQAQIVGENLGTVPPYVNAALAKHSICGMHVGQFAVTTDRGNALAEAPPDSVSCLNTHDTPTFAGFWNEADIQDRLDLGLLSPPQAETHRHERSAQREALIAYLTSRGWLSEGSGEAVNILRAWLCHLASGNTCLVLVNLEDLWLEMAPQNVPGTWEERPNWKRKARFSLERLHGMDSVAEILKTIHTIRRRGS
jgi:4-alpha-glucanotransferase